MNALVDVTLPSSVEALIAAGVPVMPCRPEDERDHHGVLRKAKSPRIANWWNNASCDRALVAQWWHNWPDSLPGVPTGSRIGVDVVDLDVDKKTGERIGETTVAGLGFDLVAHGFHAKTRSGGAHVYFEANRIGNGVRHLPGVDTRSDGAQVIAWDPQALIMAVEAARCGLLPQVPAALRQALGSSRLKAKAADTKTPLVELDLQRNIDRAVAYLRDIAPEAVEEAGGDDTTFFVACEVKDHGISESLCLDLMGEHWNEAGKTFPRWDVEDLQRKIANAYRYGKNAPGVATPEADFPIDDLDDDEGEAPVPVKAKATRRGTLVDLSEDRDFVPEPELIRDTITDGGMVGFIGGQSGALKTFAAIELAVCLATGEDFAGRKVERTGGVVLAAFEGETTLAGRLKARRTTLADPSRSLPIRALTGFGRIATAQDYQAFGDAIVRAAADIKAKNGVPLVAVLLDTVAAAGMIPEDRENDAAAWQAVFDGLRPIARHIGAPIILVHHYGKSAAAGLRGSSNARAGADFVIALTCDRDEQTGKSSNHRMSLTKSRDGHEGPIANIKKRPVVIGYRSDHTPITTLALEFVKPNCSEPADDEPKISTAAATVEAALRAALNDHGVAHTTAEGEVVRAVDEKRVRDLHKTQNAGEKVDTVRKWWRRGTKEERSPCVAIEGGWMWWADQPLQPAEYEDE